MADFEKLGAFYLGRTIAPEGDEPTDDLLLYDSKDLTTHAVCVGMTGSGKTGLCVSLLEEAAIDGVPAIAIDPKGDLPNLLLAFPELRAEQFRPWIDESAAANQGVTPDEMAAKTAELWKNGLAQWGQDGERIRRFRDAADVAVYTPGSSAGLPVTVLRSFRAPAPALVEDADAFRERIQGAVSGLLALLDIEADPVQSREHILISNLLDRAWREGQDLDVATLIRTIQSPPFERLGVVDVESFFPARERTQLAMRLNALLASPGFSAWMEGEPLEIGRMLHTPEGKPRIAIFSIAHLSEKERMFFVTILLNEVLSWARSQPGTSSLRALLYMDEVFGYFPPVANPPSKGPMLTLLKQARAYGLGVVLATQNPADLDYKGLSNAGTWFLGRLQAERDKARVMEGLEGVAATAGRGFDRGEMDRLLAGLRSRVFLLNNVHEIEPALFHTRWALSYLAGPMTRQQIQRLMAPRKGAPPEEAAAASGAPASLAAPATSRPTAAAAAPAASRRPVVPPEVTERFAAVADEPSESETLLYRPGLLATAKLHYVRVSAKVDLWRDVTLFAPLDADTAAKPWPEAEPADRDALGFEETPAAGAAFDELPARATRAKSYATWSKALVTHLYRERALTIWKCKELRALSKPEESEGEFRGRLAHQLHEQRDQKVEKVKKRYATKLKQLQDKIRRAEARVQREQSQYEGQKSQTMISVGATLLGALMGRKVASTRNIGRATTAARGMGRAGRERGDIARAAEKLAALQEELRALEAEFQEAVEAIEERGGAEALELEEITVRPRKSDIGVEELALAWIPWKLSKSGVAEPAHAEA